MQKFFKILGFSCFFIFFQNFSNSRICGNPEQNFNFQPIGGKQHGITKTSFKQPLL